MQRDEQRPEGSRFDPYWNLWPGDHRVGKADNLLSRRCPKAVRGTYKTHYTPWTGGGDPSPPMGGYPYVDRVQREATHAVTPDGDIKMAEIPVHCSFQMKSTSMSSANWTKHL
ncbi:Hypothetical predicted protein [Pelobates cultripes]|uniref:Uncharacterized protein n=1 Tax=Pelobates cultripes TaxID=61616 RepID=A0AAD1R4Z3_PELCU|nr:Hypothetical predicted protein [Pelobates cultripes]